MLAFLMAGCGNSNKPQTTDDPLRPARSEARFVFGARVLRLPAGQVETSIGRSPTGAPAFARLRPDPRFDLVLDEATPPGMVFWVDQRRYGPAYRNAIQRDLGDEYLFICGNPSSGLFYQCGTPLKWATGAGILYRDRPTDDATARNMIDRAERLLIDAETNGR